MRPESKVERWGGAVAKLKVPLRIGKIVLLMRQGGKIPRPELIGKGGLPWRFLYMVLLFGARSGTFF
jgi:hypothetical protein